MSLFLPRIQSKLQYIDDANKDDALFVGIEKIETSPPHTLEMLLRNNIVLTKLIAKLNLEEIPHEQQQKISKYLEIFCLYTDCLHSKHQDGEEQQRQQLKESSTTIWYEIVIAYLLTKDMDIYENELKEIRKAFTQTDVFLNQKKQEASSAIEQITQAYKEAKDAAEKATLATYNKDFEEAAAKHSHIAKAWLIGTIILAVMTIVSSGIALFLLIHYSKEAALLGSQLIITKAFIFALLFTATLWTARMYKTSLHLAEQNHHRANALRTFEIFVKGSSDRTAKDAVLIEATRCIFSTPHAGYLDNPSADESGLKIMQYLRPH